MNDVQAGNTKAVVNIKRLYVENDRKCSMPKFEFSCEHGPSCRLKSLWWTGSLLLFVQLNIVRPAAPFFLILNVSDLFVFFNKI